MSCDSNEIKYTGNGSQTLFTFPFTYMDQDDVYVSLYDYSTRRWVDVARTEWSFANATTIEFNTAPPVPVDTTLEPNNVKLYRSTAIDPLLASFYPGSAIRAQDLNDNFEQLQLAIQEGRCQVPEWFYDYIYEEYWNKFDNTITETEQRDGTANSKLDDDHLFTAGAIAVRHDAYVQEDQPGSTDEQGGKIWNDTDALQDYFWDPDNHVWVSFTKSGPQGQQGEEGPPGLDGQGGFVGDNPPSRPQAGTLWFDTKCPTGLYVYDGVQWVGTSIPGPMGPQGDQGLPGTGGGGPTYTFLPPLEASGNNVSLNLLTLNSI